VHPFLTWQAIVCLNIPSKCILDHQVSVVLSNRVLVGVDGQAVQVVVLCTDDLDIVLEHVHTIGLSDSLVVQWVVDVRHLFTKAQVLDMVRKIQSVLHVLGHIVDVLVAHLEGTTGRNVKVACNLVDRKRTVHPATLVRLLLHLFRVSLTNTLLNRLGLVKGPSNTSVSLSNILACVTASVLWLAGSTTIAAVVLAHLLGVRSSIAQV